MPNFVILDIFFSFIPMSRKDNWLVMFYAPWCGHCKNLEPTWIEIGAILEKQQPGVRVARLDATRYVLKK